MFKRPKKIPPLFVDENNKQHKTLKAANLLEKEIECLSRQLIITASINTRSMLQTKKQELEESYLDIATNFANSNELNKAVAFYFYTWLLNPENKLAQHYLKVKEFCNFINSELLSFTEEENNSLDNSLKSSLTKSTEENPLLVELEWPKWRYTQVYTDRSTQTYCGPAGSFLHTKIISDNDGELALINAFIKYLNQDIISYKYPDNLELSVTYFYNAIKECYMPALYLLSNKKIAAYYFTEKTKAVCSDALSGKIASIYLSKNFSIFFQKQISNYQITNLIILLSYIQENWRYHLLANLLRKNELQEDKLPKLLDILYSELKASSDFSGEEDTDQLFLSARKLKSLIEILSLKIPDYYKNLIEQEKNYSNSLNKTTKPPLKRTKSIYNLFASSPAIISKTSDNLPVYLNCIPGKSTQIQS
jgi:hypothetical protein